MSQFTKNMASEFIFIRSFFTSSLIDSFLTKVTLYTRLNKTAIVRKF